MKLTKRSVADAPVGTHWDDTLPAPAAVADKGGQDECSGDHPCDHFAWCDKHRPNLPPGPDLSHEYARELDTPPAAAQCICRECDTPSPT